jgi:hypothetical protein
MAQVNVRQSSEVTIGDSAVSGLLSGLVGGGVMLLFLVIAGLADGVAVSETLSRFNTAQVSLGPVPSLFGHLAVSAIYGLLFGVGVFALRLWRRADRLPLWVAGLIFGLLLWAVSEVTVRDSAELPIAQIPALPWTLSHMIYGLTLGLGFTRLSR